MMRLLALTSLGIRSGPPNMTPPRAVGVGRLVDGGAGDGEGPGIPDRVVEAEVHAAVVHSCADRAARCRRPWHSDGPASRDRRVRRLPAALRTRRATVRPVHRLRAGPPPPGPPPIMPPRQARRLPVRRVRRPPVEPSRRPAHRLPPGPAHAGPTHASGPMPRPPRGPQSFCCGRPAALLMLPCTMKELAALWLRSAISSVLIAPSFENVAALGGLR